MEIQKNRKYLRLPLDSTPRLVFGVPYHMEWGREFSTPLYPDTKVRRSIKGVYLESIAGPIEELSGLRRFTAERWRQRLRDLAQQVVEEPPRIDDSPTWIPPGNLEWFREFTQRFETTTPRTIVLSDYAMDFDGDTQVPYPITVTPPVEE